MKKVKCPEYPSTPKNSPANDEEEVKKLRQSVYDRDEDFVGDKVIAMDLNNNNNDDNKLTEEPRMEKQDSTHEMNEKLYQTWGRFLNKDEKIEMGSTVEKSKYFGMGSEKSVMLLTSMRRVLLIDQIKMKIRKGGEIPRSTIVSVTVIDKETFQLNFVKNKMKFKCSGPKADKWKKAFDKLC